MTNNADERSIRSKHPIVGIDVGQKNCGACAWDPVDAKIVMWSVWELPGTRAVDVVHALEQYAQSFPSNVSTIVIEHQPMKNPTMVRLMHYLECFFVVKGYTVHFQDSKNKLLFASTMSQFPDDSTDHEWTYHYRKKLAVQTVDAFVTETDQSLAQVFHTSKKKDDLADALLHAMAYVHFGKVIATTEQRAATTDDSKVVARAPTDRQKKRGKLSASNVKYLLRDVAPDDIPKTIASQKSLQRCFETHFGTVDAFVRRCR